MFRFILALFLAFLSVADLSAKVYPDNGPLFDPSSPKCAIGRPLDEVLEDLCEQTSFLDQSRDYMKVSTSSLPFPEYYSYYSISTSGIEWPELISQDTLMYISYMAHTDRPNCDLNDTTVVFGVYFTPGEDNAERKVKSFWLKYVYLTGIEPQVCNNWCSQQDKQSIAPYLTSSYVKDKILQGECPKPYSTYQFTVDGDTTQLHRGDGHKTFDCHDNYTVKTTRKTVSSLTKGSYKRDITDYVAQFDYTQNFVGSFEYCPVVEEVYDTLCRGDLPGVYKTKLTHSGTDTISTVKTWYGVDSTTILHLIVNEPSQSDYDSVSYSKSVSDTIYKDIEKVYTNAVGCDSVVTCHLKVIPICDTVSYLPVIPDKFFTPNGDGINDTWNIQNISQYENYVVCIYDRHGKLLMKYRGNFSGWNGIYNGNPQPSTDYWYTITIDESDEELYGHFTLIR